MFCKECGSEIYNSSKFCTHCGMETSHGKEKVRVDLGHWSWGGAVFWFWYSAGMKFRWWWFVLLFVLAGVVRALEEGQETAIIGLVLYLLVFVYLGINSRKWAWKTRKWDSITHFLATQRVWDIWGIITFIIFNLVAFNSN